MRNPPELRQELRDTLVCLGLKFEYARVNTDKGHTWTFQTLGEKIVIGGYKSITMGKQKFRSMYDLKLELIKKVGA